MGFSLCCVKEKGGVMDKKSIGNLISYERNRKKVSLQQLASGICSVAALQRTECGERLPDFSFKHLGKYVLGEGELLLLLMRMQEEIEIDDVHTQIEEKRILQYIERVCQDEEVAANVYSKAVWVFGTAAMKQEKWSEALWYTLQGEKLLADNGLLVHLPQFLECILFLTGKQDLSLRTEWKSKEMH